MFHRQGNSYSPPVSASWPALPFQGQKNPPPLSGNALHPKKGSGFFFILFRVSGSRTVPVKFPGFNRGFISPVFNLRE
jgi:hypothetical protein